MSSSLVCYTIGDNFVSSTNQYFPCGPSQIRGAQAQNCCYAGDYCMEDGICHYTHEVSNGTGYYLAGCTDKTWQDAACHKACTSEYGEDIVYDTATHNWHCCDVPSATERICKPPTDFIVNALPPKELSTIVQIANALPSLTLTSIGSITSLDATVSGIPRASPTSGGTSDSSSSSMTTSTTSLKSHSGNTPRSSITSSSASTISTSSNGADSSNSSNSLSGGTEAGIAVGVIIGVLLILAAVFFMVKRRRRSTQISQDEKGDGTISDSDGGAQSPSDTATSRTELPVSQDLSEGIGYDGTHYVPTNQRHNGSQKSPDFQPPQFSQHQKLQDPIIPVAPAFLEHTDQQPRRVHELSAQELAHEMPTSENAYM